MANILHEIVRVGDGFYSIASRLSPKGITASQRNLFAKSIAEANGMTLSSAIYPGQVLHVDVASIPKI